MIKIIMILFKRNSLLTLSIQMWGPPSSLSTKQRLSFPDHDWKCTAARSSQVSPL